MKDNLKAIHHFGKRCGDSKLSSVQKKNPYNLSNLRHRHGWYSGGDISAQGHGYDHLDHKPVRAGPPMQIPIYTSHATCALYYFS